MKGYILTIFVIVIMPTFVRAIFGEEDVKDPHKYPWIVKVISQYVYMCVNVYTCMSMFRCTLRGREQLDQAVTCAATGAFVWASSPS